MVLLLAFGIPKFMLSSKHDHNTLERHIQVDLVEKMNDGFT